MAGGKMKSLYGLYKRMGRDAFLEAAKGYSNHVCDTVEDTLAEMESRWYDAAHTMTEAEKMVADYNSGLLQCPEQPTLACVDVGQAGTVQMI